jgi:hypothetical protein
VLAATSEGIVGVIIMPRRASDSTYTYRVELGQWERQQIADVRSALTVAPLLPGIGILVGGLGIGVAGYAGFRWLQHNAGFFRGEWLWAPFVEVAGESIGASEESKEVVKQNFWRFLPYIWKIPFGGRGGD